MGQSSIVSTDTKIVIEHTHNPLSSTRFLDIAQCLSIINRRSYRQGMNYAIGSIEVFCPDGGAVAVSTVPTTWCADNATTKGFEAWKDQRALVLKEQPSLKAKWSDFKIFLDADHVALGVANNLTPNSQSGLYKLGTWDKSDYVCPLPGADQANVGDAQEVSFHVVGDHRPAGAFSDSTTSVGLIQAYQDSRAIILHPDPTLPAEFDTGFYNVNTLPDEMQVDVMDNVANRNDNPPYDDNEYPGSRSNAPDSQFVDIAIVRDWGDNTQFSSDSIGSFIAPLGLLKFIFAFDADDVIEMVINLVPGPYKGVLAERGL